MIYTIKEISRRVKPVAEKYHLLSVYLFGSYARGTATESSDIDLIVDTSGTSIKGLFDLGALYSELETALEKTMDRYGRSFEIFDKDADYQRSVTFCILQIGELSVGLSPEYKSETSGEMQWTAIRGMRNLVAHNYGSMSREIVWETAVNDIPDMALLFTISSCR